MHNPLPTFIVLHSLTTVFNYITKHVPTTIILQWRIMGLRTCTERLITEIIYVHIGNYDFDEVVVYFRPHSCATPNIDGLFIVGHNNDSWKIKIHLFVDRSQNWWCTGIKKYFFQSSLRTTWCSFLAALRDMPMLDCFWACLELSGNTNQLWLLFSIGNDWEIHIDIVFSLIYLPQFHIYLSLCSFEHSDRRLNCMCYEWDNGT